MGRHLCCEGVPPVRVTPRLTLVMTTQRLPLRFWDEFYMPGILCFLSTTTACTIFVGREARSGALLDRETRLGALLNREALIFR